jgi:glycine/D-amino acid oxidase-like deaminating enzyme
MDETVVIVGGGVAGLCVARSLQLAGRNVSIVDPLPAHGGASFGNGGFINPATFMPGAQPGMLGKLPGWLLDPLGPLAIDPKHIAAALPWFVKWLSAGRLARMTELAHSLRALHTTSLIEWRRLLGSHLYDRYIRESGDVMLSDVQPSGSAAAVERRMTAEYGEDVQVLSVSDIKRLYPQISDCVKFGTLKKGNAYTVSPALLNAALAALVEEHGGTFVRESVLKIIPENGKWFVLTSTGNHRASDVVVAGGVWSTRLLEPLGLKIPLESQRGYHVMAPAGAVEINIPFIHQSRYIGITPMTDGLRVAGTVEFSGVDGVPNEKRANQAWLQAKELFPALSGSPHSIWTGQRPATPDSLPVIGSVSKLPGLWMCFGHGTYGMTGAPPSGRLIAELLTGQTPFIDPTPYSARRFA